MSNSDVADQFRIAEGHLDRLARMLHDGQFKRDARDLQERLTELFSAWRAATTGTPEQE